jgi:hypothetical protein
VPVALHETDRVSPHYLGAIYSHGLVSCEASERLLAVFSGTRTRMARETPRTAPDALGKALGSHAQIGYHRGNGLEEAKFIAVPRHNSICYSIPHVGR